MTFWYSIWRPLNSLTDPGAQVGTGNTTPSLGTDDWNGIYVECGIVYTCHCFYIWPLLHHNHIDF